jgi:hypothetical protein
MQPMPEQKPSRILAEALQAIQALHAATGKGGGVPGPSGDEPRRWQARSALICQSHAAAAWS